ncbi:MAG: hypothetical protein Q8M99_05040 [Methylotenera sp.]|nr:hypothetical protein [Methylotenera sp.]
MLQRLTLNLALVFLFVFTQVGISAHEVSHLNDIAKHTQQDESAPAEQCEKCISYSQVASALQSTSFTLQSFEGRFEAISSDYFKTETPLQTAYAARAPPQKISI